SERFTISRIAPAYAEAVCYSKDAMTGLRLMNQIMDPGERDQVLAAHRNTAPPAGLQPESLAPAIVPPAIDRSTKVRIDVPIPRAPYLDRQLRDLANLEEIWRYINPFMLFGRHLGYKGNFEKDLA